jgi:hypothetical protein
MIIKHTNKSHEILLTYHNGVSSFYKQLSTIITIDFFIFLSNLCNQSIKISDVIHAFLLARYSVG